MGKNILLQPQRKVITKTEFLLILSCDFPLPPILFLLLPLLVAFFLNSFLFYGSCSEAVVLLV